MDDKGNNNHNFNNNKTNYNDIHNTVIIKLNIPDTSRPFEAVVQNEMEKPKKVNNFTIINSKDHRD